MMPSFVAFKLIGCSANVFDPMIWSECIAIIAKIPASFVGIVVGSIFTLGGVVLRASRKTPRSYKLL
jgi:hypothetical protein